MADVAHSEHEPTPFERFEQLAKNVLKVRKKDLSNSLDDKPEKPKPEGVGSAEGSVDKRL